MFERIHRRLIPVLPVAALSVWPGVVSAQHGGPGGPGPGHSSVVVVGGYYRPYYYGGFYSPLYYPWYGPYAWGPSGPYGPYGAYGGYYAIDELTSAIRLEVTPRTTEVYVDGYRAGTVDEFDGFFQRLRLRPGEHEIVLYLDGYRPVHQQITIGHGADQKIQFTMVPLAPGEAAGDRPVPPPPRAQDDRHNPQPPMNPRYGPGPGQRMPPQQPMPPQVEPRNPAPVPADSRPGSISIRVQPVDAVVLIDGETWAAPASQDRLVVQLGEGRHHVEVKKDGFEQYSGDVQVKHDETVTLNISLLRRSGQE